MVVVCLSPGAARLPDTLRALEFAGRARAVRSRPAALLLGGDEAGLVAALRREVQCCRDVHIILLLLLYILLPLSLYIYIYRERERPGGRAAPRGPVL